MKTMLAMTKLLWLWLMSQKVDKVKNAIFAFECIPGTTKVFNTYCKNTYNDNIGNVKFECVLIMLTDKNGCILTTTVTDSMKDYKFNSLSAGTSHHNIASVKVCAMTTSSGRSGKRMQS